MRYKYLKWILIVVSLLILIQSCSLFDFEPPEIKINSPESGATVYGVTILEAEVKDQYLDRTEVFVNGNKESVFKEKDIIDTLSFSKTGQNTIKLKAFDVAGNWKEEEVKINVEVLGIPNLTSPSDGITIIDNTPTFDWSNVTGAIGYHIQVDNNSNFSSPEINATTTSSTYTPSSSLSDDKYYWKVRAINIGESSGGWSSVWNFTINTQGPPPPTLYQPANNSDITDNTPYFDWSDVSGAEEYQIQVDNNSGFSSPEINKTITSSNYTASSALDDDKYYWRVRAKNALGLWGAWSSIWNFTIITQGPPAPTLYEPANNSDITDNTPYFDWSDVSGAVEYQIQGDNNSDFSSPEINVNTTSSNYTPSSPLADGKYCWRVRGKNSLGLWGGWSSVWNFTIITQGPPPPTLYEPANGSTITDNTPYFDWSEPSSAVKYWIQVDNNSNFSSPEIEDSTLTVSEYTASSALSDGTYYWRVKAKNSVGYWGGWSSVWNFFVWTTTEPPNLISPSDGALFWHTENINFSWSSITNATVYNIQIDNNSNFSSPIINQQTTSTNYSWIPDTWRGELYWRVRAGRDGIWGPWSSSRYFESVPYEVGSCDTPGHAWGVYVSGNYAYVADEFSGLRVIDISNPSSPYEVGYFDTPGHAFDVYVSGNYAYVVDGFSGLRVINISTPSSPYEVGSYDTPGYALGVYVLGNYAYVGDEAAGLRMIDISTPSSPYEVGSYDTPGYACDVYVLGNYAYVVDRGSGLRMIDISNPSSPYEVGSYNTPGSACDVYVSGNYAYVADYRAGLRVINISIPSSPYEVGSYDTPGSAYGVYVSGNYAYVADRGSGLRVIDISNPSSPYEVGSCNTPHYADGVYVLGNYAYVAAEDAGLRVIKVK